MKVTIRHDNLLVMEVEGNMAHVFIENLKNKNAITKVPKADTAKCDVVYKVNGDFVFGDGVKFPKSFLWKEHTTISLFI